MEDSDDEDIIPSSQHPPLRLHHNQQVEWQLREYFKKKEGREISSSTQTWRMYRNLRFYESLIGFHKVCFVLVSRCVLSPYLRGISTCQGGTERFGIALV